MIRYQGRRANAVVNIEPLADCHVGNSNFDKPKFLKVVERIRTDPTRYTILMGDSFDSIVPDGDKRYDKQAIDQELDTPSLQENWLAKHLYPIKDKIIGIHTGNHEEVIRKRHFEDYTMKLCEDLDAKYLGWLALTQIKLHPASKHQERHQVTIFSGHSGYNGSRAGGNLNQVEDLANSFSADIFLTGHTHQIITSKKVLIGMDHDGNLTEKVRIFGVCGSFLKTYVIGKISYPEAKIMRPLRTGTITISIYPETGKMDCHE